MGPNISSGASSDCWQCGQLNLKSPIPFSFLPNAGAELRARASARASLRLLRVGSRAVLGGYRYSAIGSGAKYLSAFLWKFTVEDLVAD